MSTHPHIAAVPGRLQPARHHTRRGAALVLVTGVLVMLMGLALALTESSVGNLQDQKRRELDNLMFVYTESAANEALDIFRRMVVDDPTLITIRARGGLAPDDLFSGPAAGDPAGMTYYPNFDPTDATTYPPVAEIEDDFEDDTDTKKAYRYVVDLNAGDATTKRLQYFLAPNVQVCVSCHRLQMSQASWSQVSYEPDRETLRRTYIIRAFGRMGVLGDNTYRTHMVELRVTATAGITQGMMSGKGYAFKGSATADWWDSAKGPYTGTPATSITNPLLGSNGTVTVANPANVKSSPAAQSNMGIQLQVPKWPDDLADHSAAGDSYSTFPAISGGVVTLSSAASPYFVESLPSGTYKNVTFRITGGGIVKLYVDGTLDGIQKPLELADATCRLWIVQNDYDNAGKVQDLNGNASAGVISDPSRFYIESLYDGPMRVNGNAEIGGVVYAPLATVSMNGTFDWFGAVTGGSFDDQVNGNYKFHYDTQLANFPIYSSLPVEQWRSAQPLKYQLPPGW